MVSASSIAINRQAKMLFLLVALSAGLILHSCAKDADPGAGEGWGGHSGATDK
jgi:hypothetical protein